MIWVCSLRRDRASCFDLTLLRALWHLQAAFAPNAFNALMVRCLPAGFHLLLEQGTDISAACTSAKQIRATKAIRQQIGWNLFKQRKAINVFLCLAAINCLCHRFSSSGRLKVDSRHWYGKWGSVHVHFNGLCNMADNNISIPYSPEKTAATVVNTCTISSVLR